MTDLNINIEAGSYAGLFKLTCKDSEGNVTRETEWIPNLITDFGLNYICSANGRDLGSDSSWIAVGSGSTTPAPTDVALVAQIGSRLSRTAAGVATNSGAPLYYSYRIDSWTYAQGAIAGNIAEVGLFNTSTGTTAMTRALVRDSGGTPTTFTVFATETLTVTYELRFYPNLNDTSGSFTIGGTTHNYTQRCAYPGGVLGIGVASPARGHANNNAAASVHQTQSLPAFGFGPSGTAYPNASYSYAVYTVGSFTSVETITWGPTDGNVPGGIGLCVYGRYSYSQTTINGGFFATITPPINKTNLQTLTLTFTLTYSRYTI